MTLLFPRQAEQFQSTSRSSGTKHTNAASCSVAPIDRTVSENCTIPNPIQFLWLGRRTVAAAGRTIPKHLSLKQGCRGAEALPEAQGPNAAEAHPENTKSPGSTRAERPGSTPREGRTPQEFVPGIQKPYFELRHSRADELYPNAFLRCVRAMQVGTSATDPAGSFPLCFPTPSWSCCVPPCVPTASWGS